MNSLRLVLACCLAFLVAGPLIGLASNQEPRLNPEPRELLSPAEFPDYDAEVWRAQRNGLATKAESARLAREPESPEITELLRQGREDEALRVMRRIVDQYPERIPRLFEVVGRNSVTVFQDEASDHRARLQGLVDDARKQLSHLSREDAARTERFLLFVDRRRLEERPFEDPLTPFVQKYAGTETALVVEIELIRRLPIRERFQALDQIVRDQPGTAIAAQALWTKGSDLGGGNGTQGADPTERFFQMLQIVRELESGRYPPGEWVDLAPDLVAGFYSFNPTYAAGSIDRLLDAYLQFVKTRFSLRDQNPTGFGSGYIVTSKLFELFKQKGEGLAGMERVFADLERSVPAVASVRYLRALFYLQNMRSTTGTERSAHYRTTVDGLSRLQAQGQGLYQRKALATLASLHFEERDYRRARDLFKNYAGSYPETPWAWVAALRIGQCEEALGHWKAAGDAYLAAAAKYGPIPLARVLGRAYAARSYEARGQIAEALRHYQAALDGWDDDYGTVYSLHLTHPQPTEGDLVRAASCACEPFGGQRAPENSHRYTRRFDAGARTLARRTRPACGGAQCGRTDPGSISAITSSSRGPLHWPSGASRASPATRGHQQTQAQRRGSARAIEPDRSGSLRLQRLCSQDRQGVAPRTDRRCQ